MGSQENGDGVLRLQQDFPSSSSAMDAAALIMSDSVSGMAICSESMDPFWDPTILGIQSGRIGNSCMVLGTEFALENQLTGSSSQFPSNIQIMPKIPIFGSGNFSDMITSYNMDEPVSPWQCQNSPSGKRKRKNVEVEQQQQKNPPGNTCDSIKEDNEKKSIAESSKENYIHVRAKRGQATNSHSLAERVRREKISERMKMLQELVPGCSKITGKAVMLDEIINYVQSLQQQVEFLSMKLASVNPELNMDIENMLSKDILQSRGGNVGVGVGLGSTSRPFPAGLPISGYPSTALTPFHPLPQNLWSNDLQNVLQMGYESNPSSVNSLGTTNGLSKMEEP